MGFFLIRALYPRDLRTHILKVLGPKTILYNFGLRELFKDPLRFC